MALATMLLAVTLQAPTASSSAAPSPSAPPLGFKPSIVFFLADDFGRFNSGWNGNPGLDSCMVLLRCRCSIVPALKALCFVARGTHAKYRRARQGRHRYGPALHIQILLPN
eukprot:SAG11_NODE_2844_length_2914_cov_1.684192_1_plen_111_part_00